MHKVTSLEAALAIVKKMEHVAEACVCTPDADHSADLRAGGIEPRSTLEVTVWKSHRNPTDVRCEIEGLGLEMVGDGSATLGKCYSFALHSRTQTMHKYTSSGFRSVHAESMSEAAEIFANRAAKRAYGRRAYARTCTLVSYSIGGLMGEYSAFIGYRTGPNETTGSNTYFTVRAA